MVLDLGPRFVVLELDQARLPCCPCSKADVWKHPCSLTSSVFLVHLVLVEAAKPPTLAPSGVYSFGCCMSSTQCNCCALNIAAHFIGFTLLQLRYMALERARRADKTGDQLTLWQVGYAALLATPHALFLSQTVMLPPKVTSGHWQSSVVCAHDAHRSRASPVTKYALKLTQSKA